MAKAPITTHVLDQTLGQPGKGIKIKLICEPEGTTFEATTDQDGRVGVWSTSSDSADATADFSHAIETMIKTKPLQWRLVFQTGSYFKANGKKAFYPQVDVVFETDPKDEKQHWHVPVLLGPFGYTTYRGS